MRKLFFRLSLVCILALPVLGLAQDYEVRYGGGPDPAGKGLSPRSLLTLAAYPLEPTPGQVDGPGAASMPVESPVPVAVFPAPADVRPIGESLLPTMPFGEDRALRAAGLTPGFTTLWGGEVAVAMDAMDSARSAVSGSLRLTGAFVPRTADPQAPAWGSILPATLDTGIQSLVEAAALPAVEHTVLLANHAALQVIADTGAVPTVLLETGGRPANLLLDEGSTLQLTGPVALSDGPLGTLAMAPSTTLRMDYQPSAELPQALPLPAALNLSEEAMLDIALRKALPTAEGAPAYTPAIFALSSLGANQISLAPGSSLQAKSADRNGRLFQMGEGVTEGVLQLSAGKITLTDAGNRKTTWDNGTTPFILSLRYDGAGRVLAAETTGFSGKTPKTGSLSLGDLTALSLSRTPEATQLPKEEEEEKEKKPFNGWAIGVDYVYQEGGRLLQIPQPGSHAVYWASRTGDDVDIPALPFAGFTPTEPSHVVHNVRGHQSYDYLYTRDTAMRTALVQVDPTGLDPAALDALRAAAHGTLRLYQGSGYQELPYAIPAGANSATTSGTVYTHTPEGALLPSSFAMPAPPPGLKVAASGDTFLLSYAVPPTPTAPPVITVQVTLQYRYTEDGGITFLPFPGRPDTQQTVQQGQDLTNYAPFLLDPAPAGFAFLNMAAPTAAQQGDTVTVNYTRLSVPVTGTLSLNGPTAMPAGIAAAPDLSAFFAFSLVIEGVPVPPAQLQIAGMDIQAGWGNQFTHTLDGTPRLGAMTCKAYLPAEQDIPLAGGGGGAYAGTVAMTPDYTVTVGYTVGGVPFRSAGIPAYYQDIVRAGAVPFLGLTLNDADTKDAGPLTADAAVAFDYTRNTTPAKVTVHFTDTTGLPAGYAATLLVTVAGREGEGQETLSIPLDEAGILAGPITLTGQSANFYPYAMPTQDADGVLYTDFTVTIDDPPIDGFPTHTAQIAKDLGIGDIHITFPDAYAGP